MSTGPLGGGGGSEFLPVTEGEAGTAVGSEYDVVSTTALVIEPSRAASLVIYHQRHSNHRDHGIYCPLVLLAATGLWTGASAFIPWIKRQVNMDR